MIRFDQGNRRFNYRIVGVAIHDGRVLLHRAEGEPFWTLPGGRAEHGETAQEALTREMREELGVDVEVERLLWIVENFFDYDRWQYHEIALYFLMRLPPESAPLGAEGFDGVDGTIALRFEWHPLHRDALEALPLQPAFLPEALTNLPATPAHIVQRDTIVPAKRI